VVPEKIIGENRKMWPPKGCLIGKVFFGPGVKTLGIIWIKLAEAAEKDPTVPVSRYAKILWSRYFLVGLMPLPVWVRVLRLGVGFYFQLFSFYNGTGIWHL
jgi:hypothetical protein